MPIAIASDRMSRALVLASSLAVLSLSLAGCALAHDAWMLSIGLAFAGTASGIACGAAQAELVTSFPGGAHRAMSRWIAFAAAGDALTPPVIGLALWVFGSYRGALWLIAITIALQAAFSGWTATRAKAPPPANSSERKPDANEHAADADDHAADADALRDAPDDAPSLPLRAAIAKAASRPALWLWLFAAASCALLDEIVVALAALRLDRDYGWSAGSIAAAMSGFSIGGVVGAIASERLLRFVPPRRLMILCSLGSVAFLAAFSVAPSAPIAVVALFLLGCTAANHYPLVKATAYELAPGQPGLVNAIAQFFVVVDVGLPLAVGAIAQHFGLQIALATLAFEPLVVLAVACAGYGVVVKDSAERDTSPQ